MPRAARPHARSRLARPLAGLLLAAAVVAHAGALLGDEGPLPDAQAAPDATPPPAAFDGAWVRVAREADDEAREAALLQATESMSVLLRGTTRLFLRRSMEPPERCLIRVEERRVTITREPGPTTSFDLDAPDGGSEMRLEDDALVRRWRHDEDTHGTTVWRLADDGDHVRVRRTIYNALFGNPIEYTTTYARER